MDSRGSSVIGAEGPESSIGKEAQGVISSLLKMTPEDQDRLNRFGIEDCERKIQELVEEVQSKPKHRLVADVLGEFTALYHRRLTLETDLCNREVEMRIAAEERVRELEQRSVQGSGHLKEKREEDLISLQTEGSECENPKGKHGDHTWRTLDEWGPQASSERRVSEGQDRYSSVIRKEMPKQLMVAIRTDPHDVNHGTTPASHLTPDTVRYDLFPPPGRREHRSWDTGEPHSSELRPRTRVHDREGPPASHERPPMPGRWSELEPPSYRGYRRQESSGEDSDGSAPVPEQGLRMRQLESLARDIERFDPRNTESTIDDYLREVERCLLDLYNPSAREKLRLIWKTTSRSVHVFIESLPPATRDRYSALCQALREEYSVFTDPASATLGAFAIQQKRTEAPKEYYRRLRAAYFQGRNAPGLEEDHTFKSLFLHNLHESTG
ncbi:uncharacterized protein V3H82_008529 [Fundulus diaphanus]